MKTRKQLFPKRCLSDRQRYLPENGRGIRLSSVNMFSEIFYDSGVFPYIAHNYSSLRGSKGNSASALGVCNSWVTCCAQRASRKWMGQSGLLFCSRFLHNEEIWSVDATFAKDSQKTDISLDDDHRTIDLFGVKETFKSLLSLFDSWSQTVNPALPSPTLNHDPKPYLHIF